MNPKGQSFHATWNRTLPTAREKRRNRAKVCIGIDAAIAKKASAANSIKFSPLT
jgi:hypothetical protein